MNTVARCYFAGLSLAALARLGVAVVRPSREQMRGLRADERSFPLPVGGYNPSEGPPLLRRSGLWLLPLVVVASCCAATTFGTAFARRLMRVGG